MKLIIPALGLAAALALPAAAAEEAGRYVLKDVKDGFIRLDTRTGAVSHCLPRTTQWICESVADDRQVLQQEIAKLENDNAALKKRVSELESKRGVELPSDADLDRVMGFFERMMKRLIEFARGLDPSGQET
ncbi:MAG: hypothetical protein AB7S41_17470 [Parvibaculaceae bacterium]